MDVYTAGACVLAALAAFASGYSGVKSFSGRPSPNFIQLARLVFDSLENQRAWFQRAFDSSTPESVKDPFLSEIQRALMEIARANQTASKQAKEIFDHLEQELDTVRVRAWIELAAAFGFLSAAVQLYGIVFPAH